MFFRVFLMLAAVFVPNVLLAATISTIPTQFSKQGQQLAAQILAPEMSIKLGLQYALGDVMTFTYTAPFKDRAAVSALFSPLVVPLLGADGAVGGVGVNADGEMRLSLVSVDDNTIVARVMTIAHDGDGSTVGDTIVVPAIALQKAVVDTQGNAGFSYSATTSRGLPIDGGLTTFKDSNEQNIILSLTPQFDVKVLTPFDGIVDMAQIARDSKIRFENAIDTDSLVIAINDMSAGFVADSLATFKKATIKIRGDFSFLADEFDASLLDGQVMENAISVTPLVAANTSVTLNASLDELIVTTDVATTLTITFDNSKNDYDRLPATTFEMAVDIKYLNAGEDGKKSTSLDNLEVSELIVGYGELDIGHWQYNIASVNVYAMPLSPNVVPLIWISNASQLEAPVELYATDVNGYTLSLGEMGRVPRGGLFNAGEIIPAILAAEGLSQGRVNLRIDVFARKKDVAVSAGYKVVGDADRYHLETSLGLPVDSR